MEETKNEMVVQDTTNMTIDLFGESKTKKITSVDLSNEKNVDMVLNSMQEADFKLNDCIGKTIEVVGVIISEREVDSSNEETGEIVTRKKHAMTLFDVDGKSYVTGSNSCYLSLVNIISLKGMPTEKNHLFLEPIKTSAKIQGHSYLKLKIKNN